ncbi:hypothetical protein AWC05_23655 [Mycobacterium florentinum]|uniref:Uncharacterized protein n=2 Tax=Mycobacterium florentinum TaxID=292462 RepID=A0A1X1U6L4_MYCFL|nr:hypothetical protein AWC05_23655 [Mycobacterium florentinum]BBX79160.1 hypothetical protein MFLOJ_29470 [Mycobacterium florentinum]
MGSAPDQPAPLISATMGRHAPADHFVDDDPTVFIHYGDDDHGSAEPDPDDPIPGWRKPIALAGWGLLIAVLIALIVWGIIQLMHGAPPQQPITNTTPATATTTPARSSSTSSVPPPAPSEQTTTPPATDAPSASTEDSLPSTATTTPTTPSGDAYPLPQLPSVITLPPLPGLPTEITLPPGL